MEINKITEEYIIPEDFDDPKEGRTKNIFIRYLNSPLWTISVVLLVAIISFLLGRISALSIKKEPVRLIQENSKIEEGLVKGISTSTPNNKTESQIPTQIVASKTGTKYHYTSCPGAKQISEKNKIYFKSIDEARANGYLPAQNCKGLK